MRTFQQRLLVRFILIALAPLAVAETVAVMFAVHHLNRGLEERIDNSRRGVAIETSERENELVIRAQAVSVDPELGRLMKEMATTIVEPRAREVLEILETARNFLGVDVVTAVNLAGQVVAQAHSPGVFGQNLADTTLVDRVLATERCTGIMPGESGLGVTAAVPVVWRGEPRGILLMEDALDHLYATGLRRKFGMQITIIDGDRLQATTADWPQMLRFLAARSGQVDAPAADPDGVQAVDVDGMKYLLASVPLLSESGGTVGAILLTTTTESVQDSIRFFTILFAGGTIILLLAALAVSHRLSVSVTEPVRQLTFKARAIAAGDTSHDEPVAARDELGELARSFDQMVAIRRRAEAELGEHRDKLDNLVRERTRELKAANIKLKFEMEERERAQQARFEIEDQLRQAQKMEAIGQLAGGVAHDFNNILQAIMGNLDLVLADVDPASPFHDELLAARQGAVRAAEVVRQLLAFGRRQVLQLEPLDLDGVVADLMKMLHRLIGEHITLEVIAKPGLPPVFADRTQLDQILVNLCVNARDAMPEGGRLTIETGFTELDENFAATHSWAKPGPHVVLSVTDTGCGIDPEIADHIFEPFFTTKAVGEGTGLGLATIYGIVRQHEGMITCYSEPGVGTTFKIHLPAASRPLPDDDAERQTEPQGGHETILLAEDDTDVRTMTELLLRKAGYKVLVAADGQEAEDLLARHGTDIDLALLDVVMPRKGGREIHDALKVTHPEMPVLFSSGYSINAIHNDFILQRDMKLIEKPYSQNDLLRRVRELLDA